ncbi:Ribosome biogenesis protein [Pelomyxa schiedti]|nr:Ribosome biogenesis protein [Pelomyxa schiedti]
MADTTAARGPKAKKGEATTSATTTTTTTSTTAASKPTATRDVGADGGAAAAAEEGQPPTENRVEVVFTTKLGAQFRVPPTPFSVPGDLGRVGLCEIVNSQLPGGPPEHPIAFDFLVEGQMLVTSLHRQLKNMNLTPDEGTMTLEYTFCIPPPFPEMTSPHDDWVSCVAFQHDWVVSGSYDQHVRLWERNTGKCIALLKYAHHVPASPIKSVTVTDPCPASGGSSFSFATSSKDRLIKLWNFHSVGDGKYDIKKLAILRGHTGSVDSICSIPSYGRICSGSWDHNLCLWNTNFQPGMATESLEEDAEEASSKRRRTTTSSAEKIAAVTPTATMIGHVQPVTMVKWPTSHQVVSAGMDHTIRLWDVDVHRNSRTLTSTKSINCVDYSIFSGLLVTGHPDKFVRLWDPRSPGALPQFRRHHTQWISDAKWHPSNPHLFASVAYDNMLAIWDTRAQAPLHSVKAHVGKVLCVGWSDDGNCVATGGSDCKLRLFKMQGGVHSSATGPQLPPKKITSEPLSQS